MDLKAKYRKEFENLPWYQKIPTAATDLARVGIDEATFGFADKGISKLTGQDEKAITEAIRARMGGADLAPALGVGLMTPSAVPRLVGYMGGGPVARTVTGLLGGATEGAATGALSALGHGEDVKTGAAMGAGGAAAAQGLIGTIAPVANRVAKWWRGAKDELPPPHIGNVMGYEDFKMPPGHTADYNLSQEAADVAHSLKDIIPGHKGATQQTGLPKYWQEPEKFYEDYSFKAMAEEAAAKAKEAGGKPQHYAAAYDNLREAINSGQLPNAIPDAVEKKLIEGILQPPPSEYFTTYALNAANKAAEPFKLQHGIPLDVPISPHLQQAQDFISGQGIMEAVNRTRRYTTGIPEIPGPISPLMQGRGNRALRRGILAEQEDY